AAAAADHLPVPRLDAAALRPGDRHVHTDRRHHRRPVVDAGGSPGARLVPLDQGEGIHRGGLLHRRVALVDHLQAHPAQRARPGHRRRDAGRRRGDHHRVLVVLPGPGLPAGRPHLGPPALRQQGLHGTGLVDGRLPGYGDLPGCPLDQLRRRRSARRARPAPHDLLASRISDWVQAGPPGNWRAGSFSAAALRYNQRRVSIGWRGMVDDMRLRSIEHGTVYPPDSARLADDDGGLLEVELDIPRLSRDVFDARLGALDHPLRSGVWRYRELMPDFPADVIVSKPEGNTNLYHDPRLDDVAGVEV